MSSATASKSEDETTELKAGHPPAAIVGNRRVVKPQRTSTSEKEGKATSADDKTILGLPAGQAKSLTMSGAAIHGHADYPPEAVQCFHDKVHPVHEKRPSTNARTVIQQPRKC